MRALVLLLSSALLGACSSGSEQSAVDHGKQLFESKALSSSGLNFYSCGSCHDLEPAGPPLIKTGAPLAGATLRSLFWGGQDNDLLRAINDCRNYFMVDNQPLAASDADARALYAYLQSFEPGDGATQPFSIVSTIEALPRGDADSGNQLYFSSCISCHGAMHNGAGRLNGQIPVLPEETLAAHTEFTPRVVRLIFTEKIRHGLFLGYGGVMPPFSSERLSDQDVSDLLEALGVLGE